MKAAHLMMEHMDKKRVALKLRPLMYAKSFLADADAAIAAEASASAPAPVAGAGGHGSIRMGCQGHPVAVNAVPGGQCDDCNK